MKKITGLLICILMLQYFSARSQSFAINTTGAAAHNSAILDVTSTNKGLLIPRLTTLQRTAIASPGKGLLVYDSTLKSFYFHDGVNWQQIIVDSNNLWRKNGNDIYKNNTGNVGIGISSPKSLLNVRGGAVLFDSTIGATPVSGAGTRMMWIPAKAAFRAGRVTTTWWDNDSIGLSSFATGLDTKAFGNYSTALGYFTIAGGINSTAMGYNTSASGDYSTTIGLNLSASGYGALSMGSWGASASGAYAVAIGIGPRASGFGAIAVGNSSFATSDFSLAWGNASTTKGDLSIAIGNYAVSKSYAGFTTGLYNDTANAADPISINPLNRIFQIGNGTGYNSLSNAMTVLQNGNTGIGTTTPVALLHVKRGAVLFDSSIGSTPVSGAGTRMMWIPDRSAFRAGEVLGTEWDDANIGNHSFAAGFNTKASGIYSTALGFGSYATGHYSTSIGQLNSAGGVNSIALGGYINSAAGAYSIAMGNYSDATAQNAIAMGSSAKASGAYSMATGLFTYSKSYGGFTAGLFNDIAAAADANNINPLNRIFQIGNGINTSNTSNAMTVLQNGNIGIGTTSPAYMLTVKKDINVDNESTNAGTVTNTLKFGANGTGEAIGSNRTTPVNQWGLDFYTNYINRMSIANNGNVGIGISNPVAPLNFAATTGDKIALWTNGTTHYGFGIQASLLQIYTESSGNDIAFGYGNSAAFTENVRIKGNGTTVTKGLQVSNGTVFTKMQSGSATVGSSATAQKIITIIFPVGFASATPKVFATARNEPASSFTDAFSVSVRSITATSVTLNVQRTDSITGWGQNLLLDWFAVE